MVSLESNISKNKYIGDGITVSYAFTFKAWEIGQVRVVVGDGTIEEDVTEQCSVLLNDEAGGTVTFAEAPLAGQIIILMREMPFVQEDRYVTGSRFDPHEIEDALDIACAERQELKELADRHLTVPVTSNSTPQEVMKAIFQTVSTANEYAEKAVETYNATVKTYNEVIALRDGVEDELSEVGAAEQAEIAKEGDRQAERLKNLVDIGGISEGVAIGEATWRFSKAVASGTEIVLPEELFYVVGRHHLRLSYDGIVMSRSWYSEVGDVDSVSTSFITKIPFRAGQEMTALVLPLGKADHEELYQELLARVEDLEEIPASGEINQNAFSTVTVNGKVGLAAVSKTDTLKLVAGEGVTVTVDEAARTITFSETYRDVALVSSLEEIPVNMRRGGLIILRSS